MQKAFKVRYHRLLAALKKDTAVPDRRSGASPRSFVWWGVFICTQTHLPPKFSFSSDFGHFILTMVENAKFSCVMKKVLEYQ